MRAVFGIGLRDLVYVAKPRVLGGYQLIPCVIGQSAGPARPAGRDERQAGPGSPRLPQIEYTITIAVELEGQGADQDGRISCFEHFIHNGRMDDGPGLCPEAFLK